MRHTEPDIVHVTEDRRDHHEHRSGFEGRERQCLGLTKLNARPVSPFDAFAQDLCAPSRRIGRLGGLIAPIFWFTQIQDGTV